DGHHPRNGRVRFSRNVRGPGIRRHDGLVRLQPAAHYRSGWHDYCSRSVVRHADRALVHDTVDRGAAWTLVLVATTRAATPGQYPSSTLRPASSGARTAVDRLTRRRVDSDERSVDSLNDCCDAMRTIGIHQSHTAISPGGYWAQFSVSLATTPLLLKKIFAWLGHATV